MRLFLRLLAAIPLALGVVTAHAGPYADDLSRCLVSSTTDADRALLMKWIFAAMSLNKEVAPYVNMPAAERDKIDRETADLYTRLLTDSCRKQTRDATRYEGPVAINAAFNMLGQIAAQGLFDDPAVAASISGLARYFDNEKIMAVMEEKQ